MPDLFLKGALLLVGLLSFFPTSHESISYRSRKASTAPRPAFIRWISVRATVYYPSGQRMACGESIPATYRRSSRAFPYIAVSRDLLRLFPLHDTLFIQGDLADPYWDPRLNGPYIVKDLMNKRWRHRVDILSRRGHERDIGLWKARITHYHAHSRSLFPRKPKKVRAARRAAHDGGGNPGRPEVA